LIFLTSQLKTRRGSTALDRVDEGKTMVQQNQKGEVANTSFSKIPLSYWNHSKDA